MSARGTYEIAGKTAFITGAARGIGAAAAERLHSLGANVALVGLEPDRLAANAERLGERAIWREVDVTDYSALQDAVAVTAERFGGIDVAIANAGIAFAGQLASEPVEHVERTLAVNMLGVWRTDRAVINEIRRNQGYLLNISSLSAVTHSPLMGPYTCAKAGVEALTDTLRMETAPTGARVGCAYFGFIDTDLVKASFERPAAQAMQDRLPKFLTNPAPLSTAIDAIEDGVRRRAARVWAPRWVGAMIAMRGVLQPLSEWATLRDTARLAEGIRLADESRSAEGEEDAVLGVAARALD
ncbi:MAG TPA: short-chain dehydrogenase/reductase [Solirubrobacteraceae bacterium]|nr:short-chain dehydrogenase/reductase [Solirubrobacteraceae bacterium]